MSDNVEIRLLGKDYRVACAPGEREELLAAVAYLEGKLAQIGGEAAGARGGGERIAIMAALNLAHECVARGKASAGPAAALETESIQRRIDSIEAKLDASLARHEQLF